MFTFDRDTATLVAVVVCIAATAYLYRELKKTKEEFTTAMAEKHQPLMFMGTQEYEAPAPPAPPAAPKVMTTRKKATVTFPAETESTE